MSISVGIIGYGTIGKAVAQAMIDGEAGDASLAAVLVRDAATITVDQRELMKVTDREDAFFGSDPDVVVECAGHEALRLYGERSLERGADLLIVSVGAFADERLMQRITEKAKVYGRRIIVPSAAIGGLDRIAAGAVGGLEEVTLVTTKPPAAWKGTAVEAQVDLDALREPFIAYDGFAREAALRFPESVNVSAALSLAGIGFDRTRVIIAVDPAASGNRHEIEASGRFGRIHVHIENRPSSSNPKTGEIVAMSLIKAIRDMTSPFVIGL